MKARGDGGGCRGGNGGLIAHSLHISMFQGEPTERLHLSKLMPQVPMLLIPFCGGVEKE